MLFQLLKIHSMDSMLLFFIFGCGISCGIPVWCSQLDLLVFFSFETETRLHAIQSTLRGNHKTCLTFDLVLQVSISNALVHVRAVMKAYIIVHWIWAYLMYIVCKNRTEQMSHWVTYLHTSCQYNNIYSHFLK